MQPSCSTRQLFTTYPPWSRAHVHTLQGVESTRWNTTSNHLSEDVSPAGSFDRQLDEAGDSHVADVASKIQVRAYRVSTVSDSQSAVQMLSVLCKQELIYQQKQLGSSVAARQTNFTAERQFTQV